MNIIRLNPTTIGESVPTGEPAVRINEKGMISINKAACKLLSLTENDRLEVIQDSDRQKDFYLVKSKAGFKLRLYKSIGLALQNSALVTAILTKIPPPSGKKSISVPVARKPVEHENEQFYALLTSTLTNKS